MKRLTQWFGSIKLGREVGVAAHLQEQYTVDELLDLFMNRLAAYEDTGLEPEQVKDMAENAETRLLTWFESQYGYSVGVLMDMLDAKKEGRVVVLDEETALALAACAHGCNTNKRLFGASYMRNFRSDNPQSITYYRAIEVLTEMAERALEKKGE